MASQHNDVVPWLGLHRDGRLNPVALGGGDGGSSRDATAGVVDSGGMHAGREEKERQMLAPGNCIIWSGTLIRLHEVAPL